MYHSIVYAYFKILRNCFCLYMQSINSEKKSFCSEDVCTCTLLFDLIEATIFTLFSFSELGCIIPLNKVAAML